MLTRKKNKRRINTTFLLIENVSGYAFICLWEWGDFPKAHHHIMSDAQSKCIALLKTKKTIYSVDYYYCSTIPLELRTPEVSA